MTTAILILLVFIVWTPFVALVVENDVSHPDPDKKLGWCSRVILFWFLPMFAGMALIDIVCEGALTAEVRSLWNDWWYGVVEGRAFDQ